MTGIEPLTLRPSVRRTIDHIDCDISSQLHTCDSGVKYEQAYYFNRANYY